MKNHNDWFSAHQKRQGSQQLLKHFSDGNGCVKLFNIAVPFDELPAAATAESMAACAHCIPWLKRSLDEMLQTASGWPGASVVPSLLGASLDNGNPTVSGDASLGEVVSLWLETIFETACAEVHTSWLERNKYDPGDHAEEYWLPYAELSDPLKEKDRLVVRCSMEAMQRHGWLPSRSGDAWGWIARLRRVG